MILLIDNYDSFTYNLYQYFCEEGAEVEVVRNDAITIDEIKEKKPSAIAISPGPGRPENAGICIEVIQAFYKEVPILGICLGHQAIAAAFGANIVQAKNIKHGKRSFLTHSGNTIFSYLYQPLEVMRYHSLVIERQSLSPQFVVIAQSMDDHEIMGIKHQDYSVYGLQFHPESIGTSAGKELIRNFLEEIKEEKRDENVLTSFE